MTTRQVMQQALDALVESCADEYIDAAIADYLQLYGENFRPHKIAAMRSDKERVEAAITALRAALAAPDRQTLQAEGRHPAPCARFCESTAYEIEARRLRKRIADLEALAAPHYPLPDSLYPGSKDWMAGDYAERVEWLHRMYESKKRELDDLYAQMAAPQPEPATWPKNAAEVRLFFKADFISAEYANEDTTPHDDDKYLITAHDFLSAVDWWADYPNYAAPKADDVQKVEVMLAIAMSEGGTFLVSVVDSHWLQEKRKYDEMLERIRNDKQLWSLKYIKTYVPYPVSREDQL